MADIEEVIAKVEEYLRIVAGREKTREALRSEGIALMQQSMQQTQSMVARIMRQANDTFESAERERKSYYGAQYREKTESMQRLEAAAIRRGNALQEIQTVLEERGK
ncbi:MAG: hypothetical protein U0S12_05475 [Fimbriimonadales bacterium]